MSDRTTAPEWFLRAIRPPLRTWLKLIVEDAHHVPDRGGVLIAPTHSSFADIPAVGAALDRPLTFLGSSHLADVPVAGSLLMNLGMVIVRRGHGDTDALRILLGVLDDEGAVVLFPEGGRSRDGRVYRPRSGVARLAATAGVPVVPVGILGSSDAWPPDGTPRLRHGPTRVTFGAPLDPPEDTPGSRREFRDALHDRLCQLSGAPPAHELLYRERAT